MIDVKKKQTIKQSETAVAGFLEDLSYWSAAEAITQLIRAVIADETPNIVKAMLNTPIEHTTVNLDGKTICTYPVAPDGEAAKPQPAERTQQCDASIVGDVPEWLPESPAKWWGVFVGEHDDPKHTYNTLVAKFAYLSHAQAWADDRKFYPNRNDVRPLPGDEAELTRRVAEATAGRDRRIAELEAECERLNILIQATAEAWLSLEPGVAWEGAIDAAMKAGVGEIQKLRQQLAEATRPVPEASVYLTIDGKKRCVEEWEFKRERAAREAAESERDEANVLIDEMIERLRADEHTRSDALACWKCSLYHKLAAHRAEKGKVTK